eukprot:2191192-Rhodomonas_salina.1
MPTIGGGVPGGEEEIGRRAYKACAACRLKKRQCDNVRPCSACCDRGWECKDEDKEVNDLQCTPFSFVVRVLTEWPQQPEITCDLCKLKKLRCDKKRPCNPPPDSLAVVVVVCVLRPKDPCTGRQAQHSG